MAKQNIISGGFYGKIGELVGQRWKNIRTVRAYVKPRNPRTEKQQANRKSFGSLVPLSQLAMQLNYHASYFTSESNSEWGLRMSLASSLMKAGYELLNLLPIVPLNYTPAYVISEITSIDTTNKRKPIFYVRGTLPSVNRSVSVVVSLYSEKTEKYENFVFSTTLENGANPHFALDFTFDVNIDKMSRFIIVSNNDEEQTVPTGQENVTIASKMLAYTPIEPITMEIQNYEQTKLKDNHITFNSVVSSLADIGITDNQTLLAVWATSGASHANCKYNIYDAEKQVPTVLSTDTAITAIEYVDDTTLKVTLTIDNTLAKTQAFSEIVNIAKESLFIKPIDNSKPVLYVPLVENATLSHETFTQPSPISLTPKSYEKTALGGTNIVFTADVDDLTQFGIVSQETLENAWKVAKSTSPSGVFGIYNADNPSIVNRTANVTISALTYVSNTSIKVTLSVSTTLSDLESIAEISTIAEYALNIAAERIIYPNIQISALSDVELAHETFTQPNPIKTLSNNYSKTALQSTKIVFVATVQSLNAYGISSQSTLANAWNVSKATSGNGVFKLYEAGVTTDKQITANVTLAALDYLSDTTLRVTINVETSVNDIQALSGIVSLGDNVISIKSNSVRYPNFGVSAISNATLSHETFTKPTEVVTSNHQYGTVSYGNSGINFAATVSSLAKYGVANTTQLKNLWNPSGTTTPSGTFSYYDEETEDSVMDTYTVSIIDLAYISDTQIRVYLEVDVELSESQYFTDIVSIANKALAISNSNIRYPNFAVSGISDVTLDVE